MADNVENLVLEHLKRFQTSFDRIDRRLDELTTRMGNVEGQLGSIIQHLGHLAVADAAQQVSIDIMNQRLDRIERRLDLAS